MCSAGTWSTIATSWYGKGYNLWGLLPNHFPLWLFQRNYMLLPTVGFNFLVEQSSIQKPWGVPHSFQTWSWNIFMLRKISFPPQLSKLPAMEAGNCLNHSYFTKWNALLPREVRSSCCNTIAGSEMLTISCWNDTILENEMMLSHIFLDPNLNNHVGPIDISTMKCYSNTKITWLSWQMLTIIAVLTVE